MYNVPAMMSHSVMPYSMMNMVPSHMPNQMTAFTSYVMPSVSVSTSTGVPQQNWLTDFGATNHMTHDLNNLSLASLYPQHDTVQTTNGKCLHVIHIGDSLLRTPVQSIKLNSVLYVAKLFHNLLSVHKICLDNNCWLIFDAYCFWIQDKATGGILFKGLCNNRFYRIPSLDALPSAPVFSTNQAIACLGKLVTSTLWHS